MSQTILKAGTTYRIFNDSMTAAEELPAGAYTVNFSPMGGYSLTKIEDIKVTEKIYGEHPEAVEDTYEAFEAFERNLGVILSGAKGIGKSLFAKLVSQKAIEKGYPIILIDGPTPGLSDFIDSIEQDFVVLFDEFDKTFNAEAQESMLSLFDGVRTTGYKKMFVVTCNNVYKLNDFFVNRPGRFHFHYRFDYPTGEELKVYLEDKIDPKYWSEILPVVSFANRVDLNYDCLRAIAFEINRGKTFKKAITKLNILNVEETRFKLVLVMKDGSRWSCSGERSYDFFSESDGNNYEYAYFCREGKTIEVRFNTASAMYDVTYGCNVIKNEGRGSIHSIDEIRGFDEMDKCNRANTQEELDAAREEIRNLKKNLLSQIDHIEFHRAGMTRMHYNW